MQQYELFSILDTVESTNNYAMAQVHADMATNGQAWFAKEQWGGKGQRGKTWKSAIGENVILSIAIEPHKAFKLKPFLLSAFTASICRAIVAKTIDEPVIIKWPNDIYCDDRKAGGILIENIYQGKEWKWSIIGIGINVNQTVFDETLQNPTSLKLITNTDHDAILLAKDIHQLFLEKYNQIDDTAAQNYLHDLNIHLYKKGVLVKLKKDNAVFETTIIEVNEYGQLLTKDSLDRTFEVGEVEWVR
jgi:BirA family transcriptional regulator, biotin operon repressor / biotin---[acetyl-CoA-carboxylase] ligase